MKVSFRLSWVVTVGSTMVIAGAILSESEWDKIQGEIYTIDRVVRDAREKAAK